MRELLDNIIGDFMTPFGIGLIIFAFALVIYMLRIDKKKGKPK